MSKVNIYLAITGVCCAYLLGLFFGLGIGTKRATYSIAYACVHDNTFDHDGYKFTCFDQDDYYAPINQPTKGETM